MNLAKALSSNGEFELGLLLSVLTAIKKGDFSARMPLDWTGVHGKIADTLNDIAETNDKISRELDRVSKAVGKEGKLAERVSFGSVSGAWAREVGTEGNLGGQADVRGVSGTWKDLTDNVNAMASNLTGQVHSAKRPSAVALQT